MTDISKVRVVEKKKILLFGGNPNRRKEVSELILASGDYEIYGTLSENEGMRKLKELGNQLSLVLIGGRYTLDQRERIKVYLSEHHPELSITEPGIEYQYSNRLIIEDIKRKLNE